MAGRTTGLTIAAALAALLASAAPALAQGRVEGMTPAEEDIVERIRIEPVPGTMLPLDRPFVDETGKKVRLGDYFGKDRPVLLVLVYFRCPMLCGEILNQTIDTLKEVDWDPGREYEIVTVSFDPLETPRLAAKKKQNLLAEFDRPTAARGWHFLTGKEKDIRALAASVGFKYVWVEERKEYAHGAAIYVVTPSGKLSRCLMPRADPMWFEPRTVKFSLMEASEGKQGSTVENVLLWCFQYDPSAHEYTLQAMNVMRLAGGLTVLIVALIVVPVWLRSRRKKGAAPEAEES